MSKLKPTDKQKEALGDALRHARDSVGLTQEELDVYKRQTILSVAPMYVTFIRLTTSL